MRPGPDEPPGLGGRQLHEWIFAQEAEKAKGHRRQDEADDTAVALVTVRSMFGGAPGHWCDLHLRRQRHRGRARQAWASACGRDAGTGGGAHTASTWPRASGNEITPHVVPVRLGAGVRFFGLLGAAPGRFEQIRAVEEPGVVHLTHRNLDP